MKSKVITATGNSHLESQISQFLAEVGEIDIVHTTQTQTPGKHATDGNPYFYYTYTMIYRKAAPVF